MPHPIFRLRGLAAGAVIGACLSHAIAAPAAAAGAAEDDPFSMLQEGQFVTAVSKRAQPVSETPSAVSIITAAEIQAHGYRTLGEALAWVRGLYTRYDRNYTYLGIRGIQRPGDYNNKVLITIDGHTVNSPIYGDAPFGRELGLDLERVERIELVRGPGSSLYGSNAVLAVVNVVTRPATASPPLESAVRAGSLGERRGYLSVTEVRPGGPFLSLSGSWTDVRGAGVTLMDFGPLALPANDLAHTDGERSGNLMADLGWRGTLLRVYLNERIKHVPTGAYGTRIGDPRTRTRDGHDYVELSTSARPARAVELSARAYWDASRYQGVYAYGPDSALITNWDVGYSDVVGSEWRAHWQPAARHVITAGTEGRWTVRSLQINRDIEPDVTYTRSDVRGSIGSGYVQDEIRLGRVARLTAGLRADGDSRRGAVVSPRADLLVPLTSATTWKVLAGSAYRAPVPYETHYDGVSQLSNPNLLPERVSSYETALVQRHGPASLTLSAYQNRIRDLVEVTFLDSIGTTGFVNRGRVRTEGVEGELEWSAAPGMRARVDLAWQESRDLISGGLLSNSPPWIGHCVWTQARPGSRMSLGLGVRWVASRTTLRGTRLSSYSVTDARLGLRPHPALECGIEARNLFDAHYADPAAGEHLQDALIQDERGVFVTLALRRPSTP